MARRNRVSNQRVNPESAAQREIADTQKASGSNSPKVEQVADRGTESDFGSEPYDASQSIDADHELDGS